MKRFLFVATTLISVLIIKAQAEIVTKPIEYKEGGTQLEGFLAYDDAITGKRPGVLIIHEWRGLNDYAKDRAKQLAAMGYTAFALDMYGKGRYAKDHQEAGEWSGNLLKNRTALKKRAMAGLDVLKKQEQTDIKKMVAIGYCFGGAAALDLARAGMDLLGVVTFHGNLSNPSKVYPGQIKSKILVFQGADDNFTLSQVSAFQEEMKKGRVDWQIVTLGNAVHSFTVVSAGNDPSTGMAYNEKADRRSWIYLQDFLKEIFQ